MIESRVVGAMCALALLGCDGGAGVDAQVGSPDAGARRDAAMDAGHLAGDGGSTPDAGTPCTDPPGSACNPIVIDGFPYRHEGDTASATADLIDAYACAPATSEAGPEVHYELRLSEPRRLRFTVEDGEGVDVDLHVLRAADPSRCVSRAHIDLEQPLGAGVWRLVVDTYDSIDNAGAYVLTVDALEPAPRSLGTMWNTYYYLATEDDYSGPQDTPIYDADCNEIARVREGFHDSACVEGSGRLSDGRVINYASTCNSACPAVRRCLFGNRICYSVLDPERYPWGQGAASIPLVPDRSMAVDPDFVALGTWVYFEELDGRIPPGASEPHDGCLRADDVGGAIDGNHFDFFSGTADRWRAWEAQFPTESTFSAWADDPRCYPRP